MQISKLEGEGSQELCDELTEFFHPSSHLVIFSCLLPPPYQAWADAFRSSPDLTGVVQVYEELKRKGIEFPTSDLETLSPIHTPQRVGHSGSSPQNADLSCLFSHGLNVITLCWICRNRHNVAPTRLNPDITSSKTWITVPALLFLCLCSQTASAPEGDSTLLKYGNITSQPTSQSVPPPYTTPQVPALHASGAINPTPEQVECSSHENMASTPLRSHKHKPSQLHFWFIISSVTRISL